MKLWCLKREFTKNIVDWELRKVQFYKSSTRIKKGYRGVVLFITHHPILQSINRIFDRHLNLLDTDQEIETIFTPGPMASFHSAWKISSYFEITVSFKNMSFFNCWGMRFQFSLNVTET